MSTTLSFEYSDEALTLEENRDEHGSS
jgi:hypothetical protein